MLMFSKTDTIKLSPDEIDALVSAICTQIEELKKAQDRDAKWDITLLKKVLKKLGRKI